MSRRILHFDMDCFYAAVETKLNPSLVGRPIAVGGPPVSRSVLCTANYEARKYGVRAAMSSREAVQRCPQLIILPPRFEVYRAESQAVHSVFQKYTEIIEPLSLDEAYLDLSEQTTHHDEAVQIAKQIKNEIHQLTGLSVSAGVAKNKFLAKICSDWKKPNGFFSVAPELSRHFAQQLKIARIPGVGQVTEQQMHELGIYLVSDLEKLKKHELEQHFGKFARKLIQYFEGEDDRSVEHNQERKSIGCEQTFNQDYKTVDEAFEQIQELFEDLRGQVSQLETLNKVSGHFVKIKFHDFTQTTLERKAQGLPEINRLREMFDEAWKRQEKPFRLLGLGVRLKSSTKSSGDLPQLNLFV